MSKKTSLEDILSQELKVDKAEITDFVSGTRKLVHELCHHCDIEKFEKGYRVYENLNRCLTDGSVGSFMGLGASLLGFFREKDESPKMLQYIIRTLQSLGEDIKKQFNEIKKYLNIIHSLQINTFIKLLHIENVQSVTHDLVVGIYNSLMHGEISETLFTILNKINQGIQCTNQVRRSQFVENCLSEMLRINAISTENYSLSDFNRAMEEIDASLLKIYCEENLDVETRIGEIKNAFELNEFSSVPVPSMLHYLTLSTMIHISLISPLIEDETKISWSNLKTLETIKALWDTLLAFSTKMKNYESVTSKLGKLNTSNKLEEVKVRVQKTIRDSQLLTHLEVTKSKIRGLYLIEDTEFQKQVPSFDTRDYYNKFDWFHQTRQNDCYGRRDKTKFNDDFGYNGNDNGFSTDMKESIREQKTRITVGWNNCIDKIMAFDSDGNVNGFFIPLVYPENGASLILPMPVELMLHPKLRNISKYQLFNNFNLKAFYSKNENEITVSIYSMGELCGILSCRILAKIVFQMNLGVDDELSLWMHWNGGKFSLKDCYKWEYVNNPTGQGNTWHCWVIYPTLTLLPHQRTEKTVLIFENHLSFFKEEELEKTIEAHTEQNIEVVKAKEEFDKGLVIRNSWVYYYSSYDEWKKIYDNFVEFLEFYRQRTSQKPKNTLCEVRDALKGIYLMIQNPESTKEDLMEYTKKISGMNKMITN